LHDPKYPEFKTNYDRIHRRYARRIEANRKAYPKSNAYNLTLIGQFTGILTHNVNEQRLKEIRDMIPDILIIDGLADKIIDPSCSKYLETQLEAQAVYAPKAGHNILDEAEELALKAAAMIVDAGEKRWKRMDWLLEREP
jgi:hypothetical protein